MTTETEALRRNATHRVMVPPHLTPLYVEWSRDLFEVHPGQYADCLTCTPRTTGRSLPNYRRTA